MLDDIKNEITRLDKIAKDSNWNSVRSSENYKSGVGKFFGPRNLYEIPVDIEFCFMEEMFDG